MHISTKDNIQSGIEHEEEIEIKKKMEVEKIRSDTSFYHKCETYLNTVDPEGYNYCVILKAIEADIKNKVDLNQYIKCLFATHDDSSIEKEKRKNVQATAAVYMIYKEKEINLGIGDNLKDAIYADLVCVLEEEMSGEIIRFLEDYEVKYGFT